MCEEQHATHYRNTNGSFVVMRTRLRFLVRWHSRESHNQKQACGFLCR